MKRLLLLAEDNPDDHFLVRRALREFHDIDLEIVFDGKQALDVLFESGLVRPSLILLDIRMPKVSGLEALCTIRSKEGMDTVPIVMLSSSDEPKDIAQAKQCDATEYLLKPVDVDEYIETIQQLVRRYVET